MWLSVLDLKPIPDYLILFIQFVDCLNLSFICFWKESWKEDRTKIKGKKFKDYFSQI